MIKRFLATLFFSLFLSFLSAQIPFGKGVNLSGWFQTTGIRQVQFTKYTKKDFENIKSLGCDAIRLPINLFYMTNGSPNYTIDPLFFEFMDQVVTWTEDLQMYLLLDNHSTDDIASKNPNLQSVLTKVWTQMASHYKDRSNYIMYEIMNEPNGITTSGWGSIQQAAISAIRAVDTKHTVIVGASNFNSYSELTSLPVYTDNNLIYTFHFYDPFVFTHQGASWTTPSMESLSGVPFPYNSGSMPSLPTSLKGTWLESSYNSYSSDGTVSKVKQLIDVVVAFKNNRSAKLYCGEFGVYMPNSSNTDRVYWYGEVRKYLEQSGISWTIWDYQNGFGLFTNGSNEMFDYDMNTSLTAALGLTAPTQKTFVTKADSVGFALYSDYIGEKIFDESYGSNSIIDYYNTGKPNYGKYCLYWTGTAQYGAISLNFKPNRDLSKLVVQNYALAFCIRSNSPGTKIEARFSDTKVNSADHPWRMNFTIDETIAKWDNKWYKVYIPLKNFIDQGSWDNGLWYNPNGSFDWKAVDKFEFVSDQGSLSGKSFWFDNVYVANFDTMRVIDTTSYVLSSIGIAPRQSSTIKVFPNPVKEKVTFYGNSWDIGNATVNIFDLSGHQVWTGTTRASAVSEILLEWDLHDSGGAKVPNGLYLCQIFSGNNCAVAKILVAHTN